MPPRRPPRRLVRRAPGPVDPAALVATGGRGAAWVTVRGWAVCVSTPLAAVTSPAALDRLGARCGWRDEAESGGPPLGAGAVGWLADDGPWLPLPPDDRPPALAAPVPAVWFGVHDAAVCVPPEGGDVWLVAEDLPGATRVPAARRLDDLADWVAAARRHVAPRGPRLRASALAPSLAPDAHAAAVARILGWIADGDLYQLNLTLQLRAGWPHGDEALVRALHAANPGAAHGAWLRTPGGGAIVSLSPETFLRTDGAAVEVRPIKGTRPRGDDAAADRAAATALQASAKDAAEHVMIVDLERNDLGRVCRTGTVAVPELMALEQHPTVWHLRSTVTGALRGDVGLGELLAATYPCGSVTGAPKRMAVARTRLVEPVRRGAYCGAIGVVARGMVDLSVAIRTAVLADGVAAYGTGGGIVADSMAADEWDEAMAKARAWFAATGTRPPLAAGLGSRPGRRAGVTPTAVG